MSANKPVYIISDSPEKDSDLFGFDAHAKTIAELIAYKKNKTPLVIGVYGTWVPARPLSWKQSSAI